MKLTKSDLDKLEEIKNYLLSVVMLRLGDFSEEETGDGEYVYYSPEDIIISLYPDEKELLSRVKKII